MEAQDTMTIETTLPADELRQKLKSWEPWRQEICFSNGVKTSECKIAQPYTDRPLGKLRKILAVLQDKDLRGWRALDIGCNSGYNAICLAHEFGMSVTGIDVTPRHIEASRYLATLIEAGQLTFEIGDAMTYSVPGELDLVLHFGTLYHLPNPLLSLENMARNLKPGGYLALETASFTGDEPRQCKWIRGINNDKSNFWALSKPVLEEVLTMYGFNDIQLVSEAKLIRQEWAQREGITRVLYIAHK